MSLVFPAQRVADSRPISQEHGRVGDARRLADRRRQAVGTCLLPSLFAALPAIRNAFGVRIARRSRRHAHSRAGEFCARTMRTGRAPSRTAHGRKSFRAKATGGAPCLTARARCCCRSTRAARRWCSKARSRRSARRRARNRSATLAGWVRAETFRRLLCDQRARCARRRSSRIWPAWRRGWRRRRFPATGRIAALVPSGADSNDHLGRQSVQIAFRRRRSERTFAAPIFRAMASGGRRHVRSLDADRYRHRPHDRRQRHRRHRAIPRRADRRSRKINSIGSRGA